MAGLTDPAIVADPRYVAAQARIEAVCEAILQQDAVVTTPVATTPVRLIVPPPTPSGTPRKNPTPRKKRKDDDDGDAEWETPKGKRPRRG